MSNYISDSGRDIVYLDHSSSGMSASLFQSSADPISLASRMCNSLLVTRRYHVERATDKVSAQAAVDLSALTPTEQDLYLYNLQNRGPEPEDAILASSDILPKLLAQAMQKPPSVDWERYLDEL